MTTDNHFQVQPQESITDNNNNNHKKRKRDSSPSSTPNKRPVQADAYSRIASKSSSEATGRGSDAGWTHCPLCYPFSKKLFAQGRGIASHLHAVHTPWKEPSKAERKRRRQAAERKQREENSPAGKESINVSTSERDPPWEPTSDDIDQWNEQVLKLVQDLEDKPLLPEGDDLKQRKGVDRTGKVAQTYRSSLPPFLQAAADGNLNELKKILESKPNDEQVLEELNRTDRHLSIAEHWTAGGGHLECLKFLLETRKRIQPDDNPTKPREKLRRRDGKTALHYAARNGKLQCIDYLIEEQEHLVDEVSGDGSTPLHLACYGGHLEAIQLLIDKHGANAALANEWNCTSAHWAGMTKCESTETVRKICRFLQMEGVSFVKRQKQGHTVLHKAAQRQNKHVIEWLAQTSDKGGAGLSDEDKQKLGGPDDGGHTPSEIWVNVGGAPKFGEWMKTTMGW